MKINISSKVVEYKHLDSLSESKGRGPTSNVLNTYNIPFFSNNTFLYNRSNIFLYRDGKERRLTPKDEIEGVTLEGKVLFCHLTPNKTKPTRLFVTPSYFVFQQTIIEKFVSYLLMMKTTDSNLYNSIVTFLGNSRWGGPKEQEDAKDIMNYFMASNSYASQIDDILVDYQLFKSIMFVEVAL